MSLGRYKLAKVLQEFMRRMMDHRRTSEPSMIVSNEQCCPGYAAKKYFDPKRMRRAPHAAETIPNTALTKFDGNQPDSFGKAALAWSNSRPTRNHRRR